MTGTEPYRPDPDDLLRDIGRQENREKRGKLKVFLGMAAGVGKTYAMLQAAGRKKTEGIDVVTGYVETHGRRETDVLAEGLPQVPRRIILYRDIPLPEMDIDAVLARRPALVLVDELAHTNAPGFRHLKRYQDVMELLDNGIDVYTTVNIQHLESLKDAVEKITGITVRETVPDSLMDLADEVELVDITPEELLERFAEGKVYTQEKAETAVKRFFREGNLKALREMSLRFAAQLVDNQVRDYMHRKRITGPWKTGERLLVAVSASPYSEYLIRWTRRMAFNLNAPWIALYIEGEHGGTLSGNERNRLGKNLDLARELGAEVMSTTDNDIVKGLLHVARMKNITQIIAGKPLKRYPRDYFRGGNIVERLLKNSADIEIHIVTQPGMAETTKKRIPRTFPAINIRAYLQMIMIIITVTGINYLLVPAAGYWSIGIVYLMTVILVSFFSAGGPVILAAALSALLWNFLFIPPLHTFRIQRLEDTLMVGMYFIIAIVLGNLTSRIRSKEQALKIREKRLTALYDFSRDLAMARGLEAIVSVTANHAGEYLESDVTLLIQDDSGSLSLPPAGGIALPVNDTEYTVALWTFTNRRKAGLFTETLSGASAQYIPLFTPGGTFGVLAVRPRQKVRYSPDQEDYIQNISYQLSTVLEKEKLYDTARGAMILAESEKLHRTLLNSISHELRTPLTAITGGATGLLDDAVSDIPETRRALLHEIKTASRRLNRVVENLLDMSRLESGIMKLKIQNHDAGDLISVALREMDDDLAGRTVHVDVEDNLPLLPIDFTLMEQALINILHNASVYTPQEAKIFITAARRDERLELTIRDTGPGIREADIPYLFDKFHRGTGVAPGGTGLGLSISKAIVEAHGGAIHAGNHASGGGIFSITLPLHPETPKE